MVRIICTCFIYITALLVIKQTHGIKSYAERNLMRGINIK